VLELKNIRKNYGGVAALKDGNLKVAAGEVHLLLGENGAGKSTMMKIVAGMVERDGGEMLWNGYPVNVRTPGEAAAIGIAMVHQECLLAPHLSVAENIFLGREQTNRMGWLKRSKMLEVAGRLIAPLGQFGRNFLEFPCQPFLLLAQTLHPLPGMFHRRDLPLDFLQETQDFAHGLPVLALEPVNRRQPRLHLFQPPGIRLQSR